VSHEATDLVGRRLGPYLLERLIGQGGFAWVFAARESDGTPVAVKVLTPRYAGEPRFASRFRNECETAAQLEHPNIVRIRRVARDQDHSLFAMDLYADSLASRIAREGPLAEPELVRIASDIVRALGFAHGRGVIHRDIKPDNVLLRSDGSAVLTDFGIARAVTGYIASTGVDMTIGTPVYISPEQAQGRPLDGRADFYALGITLFKAATGDPPFVSTDWFELARMHVEQPPPSVRSRRPGLSKQFERVVAKCLAKHPDDRYRDAAELLADLTEVAGPVTPAPNAVATNGTRAHSGWAGRRWWRFAAVAGLGIVLVLVVLRLLLRPPP
jgi:serine/threonine protein kinase